MSFTTVSDRESFLFVKPNTGAHLGPGCYDFNPVGESTNQLKKRIESRNRGGFMSHQPKNCDAHIPGGYVPGPGLYNHKNASNFSQEFIKSDDDPSLYYQIQNGNLIRKV